MGSLGGGEGDSSGMSVDVLSGADVDFNTGDGSGLSDGLSIIFGLDAKIAGFAGFYQEKKLDSKIKALK